MIDQLHDAFVDLGTARKIPPTWILKDLLPAGLMFVGGPAKTAMKSTIVLSMGLAVSENGLHCLPPYMLEAKLPGKVLCFSYEAEAGELRETAERGFEMKVEPNGNFLVAREPFSWRLDDPDGLTRMLNWLNEVKPRLAILDPLRDAHSIEEKDSGGMNRLLRPLQQWGKSNDCCFVVVHHVTKKKKEEGDYEASDLRGTSALFGMADGALMVSPRTEGTVHMVATFKRGAGWARTVTLEAWGRTGSEVLGDIERSVLKLASTRISHQEMAKQLNTPLARVQEAIAILHRTGKLTHAKDSRGVPPRPLSGVRRAVAAKAKEPAGPRAQDVPRPRVHRAVPPAV